MISNSTQGDVDKALDWLAGDAVQLLRCSAYFPCEQGILQEILKNRGFWHAGDCN
jgi:hypothetical protein